MYITIINSFKWEIKISYKGLLIHELGKIGIVKCTGWKIYIQ